MTVDVNKLYELLPAVYRIRDAELAKRLEQVEGVPQQGPLKALLAVIAEQVAVLQEDLDQLYDDQFIETCADWVVPYIGDLVSARRVFVFPGARFTERAFVANTMAYRRRKGTAAVVEQLARDVTGWNANVVEYFQLLATTQYMNHIRLENLSVADLRYSKPLEFISTPFDKVAHTADVRRIASRRGKYNIPNIGIYLWRLNNYSITRAPAFKFDDRRYLFDALGKDTQLYNKPETEDEITHLAEPINVPMPITRRVLNRDRDKYYGLEAGDQFRSILVNRNGVNVSLTDTTNTSPPQPLIDICDLSDITDSSGNVIGWAHKSTDRISLDPVLGRLAFPENEPPPRSVHVSYNYGFSTEMGGGEYGRGTTFSKLARVIKVPADQPTVQAAIAALLAEFGTSPLLKGGAIEIEKPATVATSIYHELSGTISIPAGKVIELRAADQHRPVIRLNGDLRITGNGDGQLLLNGLVITGASLHVPPTGQLRLLRLTHCTVVPGPVQTPVTSPPSGLNPAPQSLLVEAPDVSIELISSISGPIGAVDGAHVSIRNSIVDAGGETEVAYGDVLVFGNASPPGPSQPGAPLKVVNSTIIGKVTTLTMELASNTIFFAGMLPGDLWPAPVHAERLQAGCVRFSYVPPGSRLPRLFRCQPADAADAARVRPIFTSLRYGDASYCQLSTSCAVEIRQGADDQAEMGAFHDLYQPQREANLSASLSEFLRFGLEAGIFFAS
jgi:hypothetical protein